MLPVGMQRIWFPLTSKSVSEDRHHKSQGIDPSIRLQPLFLVPLRKIVGFSSYQAISGASDSYEHEGFQGGQIANAVWKSHEILTITQSQDLKIF